MAMEHEDAGATTELDDELDGVEDQLGSGDDLGDEGALDAGESAGDGEEERPTRSMKDWLKADLAEERKRRQQAEARLQALEREQAEREQAAAEQAIAAAKAEWQKAYRDDDAEGLERANEALVAAQVRKATAPRAAVESDAGADEALPAATAAWVESNPWFRKDPVRTQQAIALNNALLEEGFDPAHPRFYAELDKRMRAKPRMNGSRAIGGVTRDQGGEARETARLTEQDKARMRRFQLDPNDPGARAEWLKSKRRLSEAAR